MVGIDDPEGSGARRICMEGGQTNSPTREKSTGIGALSSTREPRPWLVLVPRRRRLGVAASTVTAAASPPKTPAQVVRAWSRALNAGNDTAAGALFARNALAIQGQVVVRLRTARSAVVWNSGLPCSGQIIRLA